MQEGLDQLIRNLCQSRKLPPAHKTYKIKLRLLRDECGGALLERLMSSSGLPQAVMQDACTIHPAGCNDNDDAEHLPHFFAELEKQSAHCGRCMGTAYCERKCAVSHLPKLEQRSSLIYVSVSFIT